MGPRSDRCATILALIDRCLAEYDAECSASHPFTHSPVDGRPVAAPDQAGARLALT